METQNQQKSSDELVKNEHLLPQLESLESMMKLPVVEATWQQTQDVYEKVKGSNAMLNWALRTAEGAIYGAVSTAAPLVCRMERPIHLVDQTLVKGIDKLKVKAPIVTETPTEIYQQAKSRVLETVQPTLNRVCQFKETTIQKTATLKELSWQKANEVLATQYGCMAVSGVDNTSALAERLLDYYFPRAETDVENDNTPISADEDPVLHTVQTVGRLSNIIARRVYYTVSRQVKALKKGNIDEYVVSLIAVLRLTQYLNVINEKVQAVTTKDEKGESTEKDQ